MVSCNGERTISPVRQEGGRGDHLSRQGSVCVGRLSVPPGFGPLPKLWTCCALD